MTTNFNSLESGAAFYIISTNGGLNVIIGTVKGKSAPYWPMPANGMNMQLIDLTVTVGGQDRVIPGLPIGLEVAGRDPEIYAASREIAERVIDDKVSEAEKVLQNVPYYENIRQEGPKCKEIINPGYAQSRKQAETIENLKAELAATKGELQDMKSLQARTVELLEKLGGGAPAPSAAQARGKKES